VRTCPTVEQARGAELSEQRFGLESRRPCALYLVDRFPHTCEMPLALLAVDAQRNQVVRAVAAGRQRAGASSHRDQDKRKSSSKHRGHDRRKADARIRNRNSHNGGNHPNPPTPSI
jgi:hypothetical protein